MSSATTVLLSLCVLTLASLTRGAYLPGMVPRTPRNANNIALSGLTTTTTTPNLVHFNFTNCGQAGGPANFKSLSISPDPILRPGNVSVALEVDVTQELDGSLDLNVTWLARNWDAWLPVPCVLYLGSCHFPDLCSYLQPMEQCPDFLTKHNIPCKCPFKPGTYKLPDWTFSLEEGLDSVDYFIKMELRQGKTLAACGAFYVSLVQK